MVVSRIESCPKSLNFIWKFWLFPIIQRILHFNLNFETISFEMNFQLYDYFTIFMLELSTWLFWLVCSGKTSGSKVVYSFQIKRVNNFLWSFAANLHNELWSFADNRFFQAAFRFSFNDFCRCCAVGVFRCAAEFFEGKIFFNFYFSLGKVALVEVTPL